MIDIIKSIFKIAKLIIFVIFLAAIITLCVNNSSTISISLQPLPYQLETRLFLLIIILFFSGFIFGLLTGSFRLIGSKMQNIASQRKLKKLEKDINKSLDEKKFL